MSVQAADAKKTLKAHDNYLQKKCEKKDKFAIAYLDNDDVPELFVYSKKGAEKRFKVLGYKNNKVKVLFFNRRKCINAYYEKMNICYSKVKGEEAWDLFKKKRIDCARSYKDGGKHYYHVNGKSVSKKELKAYVKKITKGKKMTKVSYKANTAANREKVLN